MVCLEKQAGYIEYPDCGHGSGIYRIMMDIINEFDKITRKAGKNGKVVAISA